MKTIKICIGSACHLKGSYEVIEIFKHLITMQHLEDVIELSGAFCTGNCTKAVAVIRWDGQLFSVSKENAEEIFLKELIPKDLIQRT